jgi:hypothetical protein
MTGKFCFGAVVKWFGYEFEDGDSSDKLLVILGAKPNCGIIAALTTSQHRGRPQAPGCQSGYERGAFYYLPGGMKDSFKKDTWVELYRPQEIDPGGYAEAVKNGKCHIVFNLTAGVAAGIRNCMKLSPDTTPYQVSLLE